jgi:hypothetical protein
MINSGGAPTRMPSEQLPTKTVYVTRTGLPLSFKFDWPFRPATSGADFDVLHAEITLENSGGLRALVAVNLSVTLREVFPSLDAKDTEAPIISALRKEIDHQQLEFQKSAKLVPVHFSSRHYNLARRQWMFGHANEEEIARLIERKVFWQTLLVGGDVLLNDAADALYLETATDHLVDVAAGLAKQNLFTLARRWATALPALMEQRPRFEKEMADAAHQLERKHAFERG